MTGEPDRHRGARIRLIVISMVLAVALGGGLLARHWHVYRPLADPVGPVASAPTTVASTSTTTPPVPGRYHQPPSCDQLSNDSLTFLPIDPPSPQQLAATDLSRYCEATAPYGDAQLTIAVSMVVSIGPEGVAEAAGVSTQGDPVSGTDFENPPVIKTYEGEGCTIEYARSNESVKVDIGRRDVSGPDACEHDGLPYVERLYPLIG